VPSDVVAMMLWRTELAVVITVERECGRSLLKLVSTRICKTKYVPQNKLYMYAWSYGLSQVVYVV
jgi:hypothetical protein